MQVNVLKNEKQDCIMKTCKECKYIQRPYRKDINDTYHCEKISKLVELNYSCSFWKYLEKE